MTKRVRYLNGSRWADLGEAPDVRWLYVLAAIATFVCGACRADELPDADRTPGQANPLLTQERVCDPAFKTPYGSLSTRVKRQVYAAYRTTSRACGRGCRGGCEVDYLVSLDLGGMNTIKNLWPQKSCGRWNARDKDRLEHVLHALVCSGDTTLREAQDSLSADWVAAYQKYVGDK